MPLNKPWLNYFQKDKDKEEIASEAREKVKDLYNGKIRKFLNNKGDDRRRNWPSSGDTFDKSGIDQLERLFSWGELIWDERNKLLGLLSVAEERNRKLEADLAGTQRRLRATESAAEEMREEHRGKLDHLKSTHSAVIKREQASHGREVKKLVGQLLVNQDDNLGWTDDKLKFRYRQLQDAIKRLVSPSNREMRLPSGSQLGQDLDPTRFLTRTNNNNIHFLLQSTLWAILYKHLFLTPFGFGILGQGKGQRKLIDMYISWSELLGQRAGRSVSDDELFELFRQSKSVNNWRSATFQCINEALKSPSGQADAPGAPIAGLMLENINEIIRRIINVILAVSRLSGSSPRDDLAGEVRQVTELAQDLALQFGLHPAQLQLLMPRSMDEVQIGADFHDCENGDCERGTRCLVDIVTLPGLRKVGDGRSESESKNTLVPCEVYPYAGVE